MEQFAKNTIFKGLLKYAPIALLFISVLNEFDFNYLDLKYFSFNFHFILIFYWSLKKTESLGYGLIFIAGLINDVVVGFPMGISSLSYLLICGFTAYLRNITLRPSMIQDWLFFTYNCICSSLSYSLLVLFFRLNLVMQTFGKFIIYIFILWIFAYLFQIYNKLAFEKR